jgi:Fungal Zn(2)-Cys(6) binuclear cluster domain
MDFSLNVVDPSLYSRTTSDLTTTSSALQYLTSHDFDLSLFGGLVLPPKMAPQTIQPSQLSDLSASPSPPSSQSSSSSTPVTSPMESFIDSPRPSNSRATKRHAPSSSESHDHAKRHQTKLACTWCRKLSKKCDEQRPCGRCMKFNRCDECVDAPPRKPRTLGHERGTYRKTRELAAVNFPEAVARRETYIAKKAKEGKQLPLGLTGDEVGKSRDQENGRKDIAVVQGGQDTGIEALSQPMMGHETTSLQGGSGPFTGPLEDLFTCVQSPEIEQLPLPSFSNTTNSSPVESLSEISTPVGSSPLIFDEWDIDRALWEWQAYAEFPSIMELAAVGKAAEDEQFDSLGRTEGLQPWPENALGARSGFAY